MAIDLTVPGLDSMHRRAAEWAAHDADVISATVAEMDFPLAPPVADALHRAIDRDDLGYPGPAGRRCGARSPVSPTGACAGPSTRTRSDRARRDGWPGRAVPDDRRTREAVAFATPAYPPFFGALPRGGEAGQRRPARRRLARPHGLEAVLAECPRARAGRPTIRRSCAPASELEAIAERCAAHEVWVWRTRPCAADAPGATHIPWLKMPDAARRWGVTVTSASKAFNLAALKAALIVTADPTPRSRRPDAALARARGAARGDPAEAAFDDGDAWLDAVIAQLDANREQLTRDLARELPNIAWRPPEATYLAWLDCAGLGLGDEPAEISSPKGESRSDAASTTAPPAPATSASTSPRVPSTCRTRWRGWRAPPPTGNWARRPARPLGSWSTARRFH